MVISLLCIIFQSLYFIVAFFKLTMLKLRTTHFNNYNKMHYLILMHTYLINTSHIITVY